MVDISWGFKFFNQIRSESGGVIRFFCYLNPIVVIRFNPLLLSHSHSSPILGLSVIRSAIRAKIINLFYRRVTCGTYALVDQFYFAPHEAHSYTVSIYIEQYIPAFIPVSAYLWALPSNFRLIQSLSYISAMVCILPYDSISTHWFS